jgi:hypothetical protein
MPDAQPNCCIPVRADAFAHGLPNLAKRLADGGPVKIVAIGSSSTAGEGEIVPYPYWLQKFMRKNKYKDRIVDVLNRGIGGQEAPAELDRVKRDVIDENPALVIWQVGTNAVWQPNHNLYDVTAAIVVGLMLLASESIDVVLMDLQYAPALLADDKINATRRMLSLINQAGAARDVNVFGRFAMMRKWHEVERFSFDTMIDPTDETRLHQSDWSTQRVAFELCETIAAAAARPV